MPACASSEALGRPNVSWGELVSSSLSGEGPGVSLLGAAHRGVELAGTSGHAVVVRIRPMLLGASRLGGDSGVLRNERMEPVRLSKRAKGMRGCGVASSRCSIPSIEDREGRATRGRPRDAKPKAGAFNQYGARCSGSRL